MSSNQSSDVGPHSQEISRDIEIAPEERTFLSEVLTLSATGILMKKGSVSVRMFQSVENRTIISYVIQETSDSYIGLLPSVLVVKDGVFSLDYVSAVPLVKMFKTAYKMMTLPTPTIFYHYLNLTREKFSAAAGYFNSERVFQIEALLEQLKGNPLVTLDKKDEETKTLSADSTVEIGSDTFFISGSAKVRH